jgi:outer membrane protein insertion porin family
LLFLLTGAPAAAQPPAPSAVPDSVTAAPAPESPTPEYTIGRIAVVGNVATDSMRILRSFEVPPGARYSDDAVRRGIRKLFALGVFQDVWVERTPRDLVVDLVIHVQERPRLGAVGFRGNAKRETAELEKKLILRPGDVYSPVTVQTQIDSLVRYYREEGFARVSIAAEADTSATPGRIGLTFVVSEGERMRIREVRFEGATAFPEKKLRSKLKTKKKGLFGGGEVSDENLTLDREQLERFYKSQGYRDMRWVSDELLPGEKPGHLVYVVRVDEGRFHTMGTVAWTGNLVVATDVLERMWRPKAGERYDVTRIERVQGLAYQEYAERGFLYLGIEPEETARDTVVDVTFRVQEGRPSDIRYVHITGNRGTRENVIRREMQVHEGDRFKRSALVRTQGDIMRLGLFENVEIDFAPAESTDVDINLKVVEKQVGTASAGAGYTNESGLTGFLELGHNNVLGNGQSLSLHLERGANRSDYFVSFSEPWFRGTPTLLGFSVFRTERDRDLYEEKRVGGSARIGRPLPWPDFSRGSISYRLEDVTITQLGSTLTTTDSIALSGIPVGRPVRTSSMEVNFLRNSTDNPFYPTKGTRLQTTTELAGGPFGGAINFHKHRIEGRAYLPSLFKPVTTMLRARVGLLGEYADQNSSAPPYERFRLGGGTTIDPLRGYGDYMVVPEKFITDVVLRYDTTRVVNGTDTTTTISPVTTRVRYPGGRFMTTYTLEQQFPIVPPLRGVIFLDAGNTWDLWKEIRPLDLKVGAGIGFRMEIPLLGNIGFDYGYGFHRDDGPRAVGHFLLGNLGF